MRECGDCNLCCIVYNIEELDKPQFTPCQHLCSKGCSIQKTKPKVCKTFSCMWRDGELKEEDRPDKIGAVFFKSEADGRGEGFKEMIRGMSNPHVENPHRWAEGTKARNTANEIAEKMPVVLNMMIDSIGPWDEDGELLDTAEGVLNTETAHRRPREPVQISNKAFKDLFGF